MSGKYLKNLASKRLKEGMFRFFGSISRELSDRFYISSKIGSFSGWKYSIKGTEEKFQSV